MKKSNKLLKNCKKNPWTLSTGILTIVLVIVLFTGNSTTGTIVSADEAGAKIIEFANAQGANAELVNINDDGSLYEVIVSIEGQEVPLYVTKDGKNLAPSLIPLESDDAPSKSTQQQTQQQAQQESGSYTEADLTKLTEFSNCLADEGIVIYGANWCGWTEKLVVETLGGFGTAASAYVECTENEAKCSEEGVTGYPTVKQNGEVYQGGRTLTDLSQATGCSVPELEGSQAAPQQAPQAQTGYTEEDLTKISEFSECLSGKGVKIYGANWCGWTEKFVVETLGGFDNVAPIYVECTENEAECSDAGVTGYPTTQINGEPYSGARTIEGLASATGCVAPELEGAVQQAAASGAAPSGGCGA